MKTHNLTNAMPAILFRERVCDDAGKPLTDIPENWDLSDSREPELLELGRGQLLILETDVLAFLDDVMLHHAAEGDQTIRAIFTPEPQCPEFRMGDILIAVAPDLGSISYEVLLTHGELPDRLPNPGEMCLVLRAELSLV